LNELAAVEKLDGRRRGGDHRQVMRGDGGVADAEAALALQMNIRR